MGVFNGMRSAGLACGLVAGVVLIPFDRALLIAPYLVVMASGLLGFALLIALPRRATQAAVMVSTRYLALLRDPLIRSLVLYRASLAMVTPAVVAFLPVLVKAHESGALGMNGLELARSLRSLTAGKSVALGAIGTSAGAFQIGLGWLLDRRGRLSEIAAVIVGALLIAAVLLGLSHVGTFGSLMCVSVLAGLGIGALFLPGLMLLIRAARTKGMGRAVALAEVAAALGAVVGATVAAAAATSSPRFLFPATALFPLLAAAFYVSALRSAESEGSKGASGQR
jgi:MFS family permease